MPSMAQKDSRCRAGLDTQRFQVLLQSMSSYAFACIAGNCQHSSSLHFKSTTTLNLSAQAAICIDRRPTHIQLMHADELMITLRRIDSISCQ